MVDKLIDYCRDVVANEISTSSYSETFRVMNCSIMSLQRGLDTFYLLYASSLVFFMQAGFAMVCAGCVQKKNIQNSMLKNLLDACGAAIGFYCCGYAFAFGGSTANGTPTTFIGTSNFFLMNYETFAFNDVLQGKMFWMYEFAFAATAGTIIAGTLAERCQMGAYFGYSILLTSFVYPVVAHAVWSPNGFLNASNATPLLGVGMVDFAGSGVVHTTGGFVALIATKILGARRGRFYDERGDKLVKAKKFVGHSAALQVLGTFILWFGWYGFNPGSALFVSQPSNAHAAARAAVTTTLSAAAGGISALAANFVYTERRDGEGIFDLGIALNGSLGGLVAITAGCTVVETWISIIIGTISGWIYLATSLALEKLCLDDAVDAIPVHLANGIWGCIAVGLMAAPDLLQDVYGITDNAGWFYEWARGSANGNLLAVQLIGLLFIMAWSGAIMFPFFTIIDYMGLFRSDSLEEMVGLDISYHGGENADGSGNTEFLEAMKVKKTLSGKGGLSGFFRRRTPSSPQANVEVDVAMPNVNVVMESEAQA